jgi:hypothetical protein
MVSVKLAFILVATAAIAAAQVKITRAADKIPIDINGKPFTTFYVSGPEVAKPFLWPLHAATGTYVTRMWPMETVPEEANATKDHRHQRGLWFAHAKVNDLDFWNIDPANQNPYNRPDRGKIVLDKIGKTTSNEKQGSIAATFKWTNKEGDPLLTESRVMTFYTDPTLRTFDLDITLTAVKEVNFGDEKDGVLGIRLRPALQEKGGSGVITNAESLVTEKQLWGKPSNWCDYSGDLDGEKVGVAILDHPSNPRHPVRWHARDYGLFAANPFGLAAFTNDKSQNGAVTLQAGQSLRYRYRIVIHPGDVKSADIAGLWTKYSAVKP